MRVTQVRAWVTVYCQAPAPKRAGERCGARLGVVRGPVRWVAAFARFPDATEAYTLRCSSCKAVNVFAPEEPEEGSDGE